MADRRVEEETVAAARVEEESHPPKLGEEVVESRVNAAGSSQDVVTESSVHEASEIRRDESSEHPVTGGHRNDNVKQQTGIPVISQNVVQEEHKKVCELSSHNPKHVKVADIGENTVSPVGRSGQNVSCTTDSAMRETDVTPGGEISAKSVEKESQESTGSVTPCTSDLGHYGANEGVVDVAKVVKKLGEIVKSIVPSSEPVEEKTLDEDDESTSELPSTSTAPKTNKPVKTTCQHGQDKSTEECIEKSDMAEMENVDLSIKAESVSTICSPEAGRKTTSSNTPTPRKRGRPRKWNDDTQVYTNKEMCSEIMKLLKSQREEGNFCDVVIHVQGCQYWAHKCVLAASSPYFNTLLKQNCFSTGSAVEQVTLPCENRSAFESVLDYMYTGKLTINLRCVPELLSLAEKMSFEVIKKYCQDHLCRNLTFTNWVSVKNLASEYNLEKAWKHVFCFLLDHMESVSEEGILAFTYEEMAHLLGYSSSSNSNLVVIHRETQKLITLMQWVQHNMSERQQTFEELLRYVDPLMLDRVSINKILKKPKWRNSPLTDEPCLKELLNSIDKQQEIKQEEEKSSRSKKKKVPTATLR